MVITLDNAKSLWLYDGIVATGYHLNNGVIEADTTEVITSDDLFLSYAPQFNFELNKQQLVAEGLKRGFITKVGEDKYLVNENY